VCEDMDDSTDYDGPCGCLVESDVLVERDEAIEWGPTKEGNEVPADGEENEDDVEMEHQGGSTSSGKRDSKGLPRVDKVVLELIVDETEYEDKSMEKNPNAKEYLTTTLIDFPYSKPLSPCHGSREPFRRRRSSGAGLLQALKPPPLSLIALEVRGLVREVELVGKVRVVLQVYI